MIAIKPGDWVRIPALWPGIWKVSHTLAGFKEDRWSLTDPLQPSTRTLVFCHRLLNDSWQRSFFHQCCEVSLVQPLPPADLKKLEAFLSADTKLLAAFEKYQSRTKKIDLVANLGFGGFNKKAIEKFPRICAEMLSERIAAGLTMDEVLGQLRERGLDLNMGKLPQQATLQLVSEGHELRGDRFLYRRYKTLGF